jgi:hypothetical protein
MGKLASAVWSLVLFTKPPVSGSGEGFCAPSCYPRRLRVYPPPDAIILIYAHDAAPLAGCFDLLGRSCRAWTCHYRVAGWWQAPSMPRVLSLLAGLLPFRRCGWSARVAREGGAQHC